jgi:hypothetical protein
MADRSVTVRLRAEIADYQRKLATAAAVTAGLAKTLDTTDSRMGNVERSTSRAGNQLDSFSGRAGLVAQGLATIGPAAVPITAVAIPALVGLGAQLGFTTLTAGSAVVAFQGVGNALKELEKYRLDPTAANLESARTAVAQLGPDAQSLVLHLRSLRGEWIDLRDASASGLFPGVEDSLNSLETRLPGLERILHEVSAAGGDILAEGAASVASDRWDFFFNYLLKDARGNLDAVADSTGNVVHGLARILTAFSPLQTDFNEFLKGETESFDEWATRLNRSDGLVEFFAYVRENGPQVADTFGAVATAVLQIVEAASPLGGPVLATLEAVANVIGAIADSDLGSPILTGLAVLSIYSRATKLLGAQGAASFGQILTGQKQVDLGYKRGSAAVQTFGRDLVNVARYGNLATESAGRLRSQLATAGRTAGLIGGLALASSDVADKMGLANTASLALMGSLGGPPGMAIGAAVGATIDLAHANDDLEAAIQRVDVAMDGRGIGEQERAYEALRRQVVDTQDDIDNFWRQSPEDFGGGLRGIFTDAGHEWNAIRSVLMGDNIRGSDQLGAAHQQLMASNGAAAAFAITMGGVTDELHDAAGEATTFSNALAQLNGWLSKEQALLNYRDALDGIREGLKDGFGRDDLRNILSAGDAITQVASQMKSKDLRADFLTGARAALVEMARDSGPKAAAAVQRVIDKLDEYGLTQPPAKKFEADDSELRKKTNAAKQLINELVGKPYSAKITADGKSAILTAQQVRQALNGIDRYIPVEIHVSRTGDAGLPYLSGGQRHAGGGQVRGPGTTTSDSIPALLSDREYVMPADAVDHYGLGFMDAVRARHFAGGGLADVHRVTATSYDTGRPGGITVIRQELPGRIELVVGGHRFPAYIRSQADDVARNRVDSATGGREGTDRMKWGD